MGRGRIALLVAAVALAGTGAGAVATVRGDEPEPPEPTPRALPAAARSPLLATTGATAPPAAAAVAAALAGPLADPALGGRTGVSVVDVATGEVLVDRSADVPVTPASTAKLLTAAAALTVLGPDARLVTRVVAGATPGEVVLVGGGDPTLSGPQATPAYPQPARLADLAAAVRKTGTRVTRVVVDGGLFVGPRLARGWKPSYFTEGAVAPVSAVSVDAGRVRPGKRPRVAEPDLAAGRALAALLGDPAIPVVRGTAPAAAGELGRVQSPPMTVLVEAMVERSDNDIAEALARHVAIAEGAPATFDGGAQAVTDAVVELGLDRSQVTLADGSGLSRLDAVSPAAVVEVLRLAAGSERPALRPLVTGLPVAGFSGTLDKRFRRGPAVVAAGEVRAKTGTLSGVSALAGVLRTDEGRLLAFAVAAVQVPSGATRRAEGALDRVTAALAGCCA